MCTVRPIHPQLPSAQCLNTCNYSAHTMSSDRFPIVYWWPILGRWCFILQPTSFTAFSYFRLCRELVVVVRFVIRLYERHGDTSSRL
ncbi:hypothetical protein AHF37_12508, partial [Paragonimus kellicotti]